jgi:hypothetical protein
MGGDHDFLLARMGAGVGPDPPAGHGGGKAGEFSFVRRQRLRRALEVAADLHPRGPQRAIAAAIVLALRQDQAERIQHGSHHP